MFTKIVSNHSESACEVLAVNMNVCPHLDVTVCVGVWGRERAEHMSMTQSNLHWFPLHVW